MRERQLELAAQYPRARSSAIPIRGHDTKSAHLAPTIEWPSPAVMPGDRELNDFVHQRAAKPLEEAAESSRAPAEIK